MPLKRPLTLVLGLATLAACLGMVATPAAHASIQSGASPLGRDRVVSYEPESSGNGTSGLSTDLWAAYGSTPVAADLALIRSTGADAVRVFIGTGDTGPGYPTISPTFQADFANFILLAASDGLYVVPSIFNMYPYSPLVPGAWSGDLPHAEAWMKALLAPYKNDPEIVYIEMRNEIPAPGEDAPNPSGSGVQAAAWLNTMMPRLRADAGSIPVVLSQNNGMAGYEALDAALTPAARPDAYGYHYYDSPGYLYGQLTKLESALSEPVFVEETGYSTASGYTGGGAAGLATDGTTRGYYQGWYLQAVSHVTSSLGMGFPGIWDLWDTTHASSTVEADFGLFDASTGATVAKPAAAVVHSVGADLATLTGVPAPDINGTFSDPGSGPAGGVPAPWQGYYASGATTPGGALSGNSLCINNGGGDSYFYEILPLAGPTGTHTLSLWSKGGSGYTSFAIRWLGSTGAAVGPDSRVFQPKTEGGWTPFSVSSVAPAGASTAEIILQANTAGCFSNVSFN